MKTRNKMISAFAAMCGATFIFAACGNDNASDGKDEQPPEPVVSVTVKYDGMTIKDTDVDGYDYTYMFSIISDGQVVSVDASYIDSSDVVAAAGTYDVVCTYGGQSATAKVNVSGTVYTLDASCAEITLITKQVGSYNFKALFTAKKDGAVQSIDDGMVTSNVKAEAGSYTYSVTYAGITKTVMVHVMDDVIIVPSYSTKTLQKSELSLYDYTDLFSLYDDGHAVRVTKDMLDLGGVESADIGETVAVGLSYTKDRTDYTATVQVKVVADLSYTISSRDVVIYPHSQNIELESLFEIKHGDETVPVTSDMISGTINYSLPGEYEISISAYGQQASATVKIEDGVIVEPAAGSDTVFVRKGADKAGYAFSCDFKAVINGVEFFAIPDEFFDGLDEVDFTTEGDYDVTLKVPYNTKRLGISGKPTFEYTECKITYSVRERVGSAQAKSPLVVLKRGDDYNVFDNVHAMLNGRNIDLTDNPDWVSVLAVYAKVNSDPIDMTSTELQHVEIDVYVNGNDEDPITVEYNVSVRDDVTITVHEKSVFTGETLFTTDLFEVISNGEQIKVTADMITGKVDTFTPGVYEVTLERGGVSATAYVTVFDRNVMGTYKTLMTAIPVVDDDDDDEGGEDYGDWYGDGEYYSAYASAASDASDVQQSASAQVLGDMIMSDNGNITVNGMSAALIGGVDENTLVMRIGSYNYTMYYNDGIAVLDPDNSVKLGFSDASKRPLVYFNSELWNITQAVTVNYGENYVLSSVSVSAYSIDTFHIVKKDGSADKWYGLYVQLAEKNSSDTIYVVKWGEVKYAAGFEPKVGASSQLEFCGETYKFTMKSSSVAKIDKTDGSVSKYAGKTFVGKDNGQSAKLEVSATGNYAYSVDGKTQFTFGLVEKNNNKNWYEDGQTDTLFVYRHDEKQFSYKFKLNTADNTFTIAERDKYYGKYESNGKFIYLDGYGTGLLREKSGTYETFKLAYTVNADVLTVRYVDTRPSFAHGTTSEFYIGEFLNTLRVKRFTTDLFDGETLVNSIITDGALVDITSTRFGAPVGSETVDRIKADIRKSVTIVTKDGTVSEADKADPAKNGYVDVSAISVTYAGYYNMSVTVTVGGEKVVSNYSVQIVKGELADQNYAGSYKGVCFSGYDFAIGSNAQISVTAAGTEYIGYATTDGDGLTFKAYSATGGAVIGKVERITNGVILLSVTGTVNFRDYYTKAGSGSSRVVGISGTVLREISTADGQNVYVLASSAAAVGDVVTLTTVGSGGVDNGSTVKLERSDGMVKYIKILKWGDTKEGIEILTDPGN